MVEPQWALPKNSRIHLFTNVFFYSFFLLEYTLKNATNDREIKPQDKKRSTRKNDIEFENRLTVVKKGLWKCHKMTPNVLKKKCPQT